MNSATASTIRNGTIPLTELVRAGVGSRPVSIPLAGTGYARLEHVTGIPAPSGDGGYSLNRLKALDLLIARIRGAQEEVSRLQSRPDPVEQQEELLEELSLHIVEDLGRTQPDLGLVQGFLVDMTA